LAKGIDSESTGKMAERRFDFLVLLKSFAFWLALSLMALFSLSDKVYSDMGGVFATDARTSEGKPVVSEVYLSEGLYFKLSCLRAGVKQERVSVSAEEKKVYGVNVSGPTSKDEIASMGVEVKSLSARDATRRWRGEVGGELELSVIHKRSSKPIPLLLRRVAIPDDNILLN